MLRTILSFFKQETAYEMRISDWSSDVCSSALAPERRRVAPHVPGVQGSGRDRKWTGRVPMAARRIQRKAPAGPVVEHQIVFADHDARPILGKRVRVDDDNAITFAVGRSDDRCPAPSTGDRKSTRLNSSH